MYNFLDKLILEKIPIPPDFPESKKCVVKPKTENWLLVGVAFDYLLRTELKRLHPDAVEVNIIGVMAYNYVRAHIRSYGKVTLGDRTLGEMELRVIERVIEEYFEEKEKYLNDGVLTRQFVEQTIRFARFDTIYRDKKYEDVDAPVDERDIDDLIELLRIVPDELKNMKGKYLLNPGFKRIYGDIRGDADLVIGNTLIDIKTVHEMKLYGDIWAQLVKYSILSNEVSHWYSDFPHIDYIGIYFSRYGKLWTISADYIRNNPNYEEVKDYVLQHKIVLREPDWRIEEKVSLFHRIMKRLKRLW